MARALLYVLTAFAIGRVHELFDFLAPLRIVLVVGVACVISTLLTPAAKRQPVLAQREVRIVLAMSALAIILLPFGVWPGGSLKFLMDSYSTLVILFLLIALSTEPVVIRNLVMAALTGGGLLGLFTLAGASIMTSQEHMIVRAYASATYDPNDVAMMMVLTLPFAALGAAALRGTGRLVAVGVAVICVLATVVTVSRGGFVGLAFILLLLLLRLRNAGARLLAGVVVMIFLVAASGSYWDVMETIWNPTGTGYVGRGIWTRVEVWERGLGLLFRRPFTGVGIGMYENASGLVYGRQEGAWLTAHNSFLQLATELGLIGFALFVALLGQSIRNARSVARAAREDPRLRELEWIATGVEISLYAYMVTGFALSQAYATFLYFLVGVAAALRLQVERHQQTLAVTDLTPGRSHQPIPISRLPRRFRYGEPAGWQS